MTNVNGVGCPCQHEQRGKYSGLKHVVNAAVATAGVVGTGKLAEYGNRLSDKVLHNDLLDCGGYLNPRNAGPRNIITGQKVVRVFEKMGEKMFKSGSKISNMIEEKVLKDLHILTADQSPAFMTELKNAKGKYAMAVAAGVTALAFIARGIYQAGKINGEKA